MKIEGPGNKTKTEILLEGNNWILPTDIESIDLAEEAFAKRLKEVGWTFDESFDLQLGFREALVNAIAHGNLGIIKPEEANLGDLIKTELKNDPTKRDKKVYVYIDVNKDRVYIKILDEGKGFRHGEVPDPTLHKGLRKTKGRGISLMKNFFDSVEYLGNGNEVIMSKERIQK